MAFTLHEATTHAIFIPLVKVESESYSTPPNTFWEVIKGPSLETCASRQAMWNASSRWIYAKDAQTYEIVDAMNWNIHEKNPYASGGEGPPVYPMKTLTERFLRPFFTNRPGYMSKPHLCKYSSPILYKSMVINICYVHPTCRHEDIENLMIEWGLKKADETGVKTFVESAQDGIGFYKVHGFEHDKDLILDPVVEELEVEELIALRNKMAMKKLLPFYVDFMVRPDGVMKAWTLCDANSGLRIKIHSLYIGFISFDRCRNI